ncbi:TonB family protein [Permianibacter sp. IMCC34836]|uniref:TonB family protein n=1 Tax=Permianibacter fluminis TaxID=2738515 RepID=UPI0015546A6C|nr:TonB family protein [Permianibacter fluminis]NQD36455.1 TonB family protein [Permianibacter fluminis]
MKIIKQILMFCGLTLAIGVGTGGLATSVQAADARVANTDLQVLGIGMAQELRTDIYLGAIFAPADVKTLDAALADNVPKRMSIKIVAEKWSARELGRTFKERIALNNPRPVWQGQGQYIIAFANTFKDNLQRGDTVTFDHVPGVGTEIAINGGKVNTIRSTSFFNLLLNAWVGDLPPSQAFKAAVTGKGDPKQRTTYIAQYDTLLPVAGRTFAAVADEVKKPADVKPAETKPVETKPVETKPVAPTKPVETKPLVAETKPVETKPVEIAKPVESKPVETKPVVAESKPAKAEPKVEPVAAIPMLDIPAVEAVIDPDLLFGDYKREAMKLFRKNQFYPPKAFKDKLTGEGVVRATVDKSGNMLAVEVVESTGERLLDRAMVDMVTKSMPLPALPPELPEDSYNIDIPVRFTL